MNPGVVIIQQQNIIEAVSQFPILPQYRNFSAVATVDGQTDFTLPDYPVLTGIMDVNINGAAQDPLSGDYTVSGNILTLNPGIDAGDKVYGFYQDMSPVVNPTVLNFAYFFFIVAIQGQTIFTLDFQPSPLIYVAVNGVIQDNEDYTLDGYSLTIGEGLDIGDKLYGVGIQ